MATIEPFRGIRYNAGKVTGLSTVIAPPYDVINKQGQDYFYNLNPYNIIRLEYGREKEGDHPNNNRYTRAGHTFSRWLEQNIMIMENRRAFYLYRQSFSYQGTRYHRPGFFAALKLEPYHAGAVLPHEQTLTKPKADRLELLRSCRANFSPVFTLFPDPENRLELICADLFNQPPLIEFSDRDGQDHRLWAIADPGRQKALQKLISPLSLLIADGHHRYETSLKFSGEFNPDRQNGYSYALTVMVSLHSPELLMLPTHRLLSNLSSRQAKALLEIASRNFHIRPLGPPGNLSVDDLLPELSRSGKDIPALGMVLPEKIYLLTLKSPIYIPNSLDVTLLQDLIFQPLLKNAPEGTAEQIISYTTDQQEVTEAVLKGKSQAGFILNPTPIEKVIEKARQGEIMPQKSTYFFPKLPSGLVIYSLEKSL